MERQNVVVLVKLFVSREMVLFLFRSPTTYNFVGWDEHLLTFCLVTKYTVLYR